MSITNALLISVGDAVLCILALSHPILNGVTLVVSAYIVYLWLTNEW